MSRFPFNLFTRQRRSALPSPPESTYVTPPGMEGNRDIPHDFHKQSIDWSQFQTEPALSEKHFRHLKKRFGLELGKELGKGSFGTVYQVTQAMANGTQRKLVCKVATLDLYKSKGVTQGVAWAVKDLVHEANIISNLDHPNVVKRTDIIHFYDQTTDFPAPIHVLIFMEMMHGDLHQLICACDLFKMSEKDTHRWFVQVVKGLQYLHEQRVVHLDIKPPNILYRKFPGFQGTTQVDRYLFKLADFGMATKFRETEPMELRGRYGTAGFRAPEMNVFTDTDAIKADIYSLGMSALQAVGGLRAFNHGYYRTRFVTWTPYLEVTRELHQLILAMTEADPSKRPTLEDVVRCKWFTDPAISGDYSEQSQTSWYI